VTTEIRYRYLTECTFRAVFEPREENGLPAYDIDAVSTPGVLMRREQLQAATVEDLYTQIERWTGFLADELIAHRASRVLAAQQKALHALGAHLRDLPDRPLSRARCAEYALRVEKLESAVLEANTDAGGIAAIKADFASLRECVGALGERSFLQAVLVRLIQHFWDEQNLRLVEDGNQAATAFLGGRTPKKSAGSRIGNALQEQDA